MLNTIFAALAEVNKMFDNRQKQQMKQAPRRQNDENALANMTELTEMQLF
jgi:hypothetical protein